MKLYMFRAVRLSIIRSLFTVHSAMVYVIQTAFEQDRDGTAVPSWSCSKAVYKPVWHIPLLSVQWINYWWWTDELPETYRVSWQNKFVKLVHLFGFITKEFVTMHGHGNVKNCNNICRSYCNNVFSYSLCISFRYVRLFNTSVFSQHRARRFFKRNKLSLWFTVDVVPAAECRYGLKTGCVADVWEKTTTP
jgi:hypothetical protein